MRALKAGVIYFLLVFAVGWVLGPIRELWAVPHFGRIVAMLSEAVIMLIAMIVAARWIIRRLDVPRMLPATVSMGLIAVGLLFPAEIAGVVLGAWPPFRSIWRALRPDPASSHWSCSCFLRGCRPSSRCQHV